MKKTRKTTAKRTAGVSDVKASHSSFLARVKAAEEDADTARLSRLAADEVLLPDFGTVPNGLWEMERPADPQGRALRALLEERDSVS
ncbi:MAG: hypothetical protein IH616_13265 [Gemmatimonadales bacterium]|nr:hypothetical protein [Gemmatimonadales bacterium]